MRPNPLIYGEFDRLVPITIGGERFEVPEGIPLIRALQYVQFELDRMRCDWSLYCFNDTIGCCACRVRRPDEGEDRSARACCERVVEGLEVTRLPRGAQLLPAPTSPA
ncbi:MAG: hypothetical protein H6705_21345 [Myxococcales bacterium]|nr:hypothetical protein [Myxococcales bacterium]